jgi:hypothetical protein
MTNDEAPDTINAEPDPPETNLVVLVKKMQQQLNFLEKKIDLLLSQSQPKSFGERPGSDRPYRKSPFSKPARSFDRPRPHGPRPHGRGDHEQSPRDRDSAPGRFYDRFKTAKKRSANPKRKPYHPPREERE